MYERFELDLEWSTKLFVEQIWPICRAGCGGGELIQIEGHTDDKLKTLLDTVSGIDGFQVFSDGLRGIASRVQITPIESYDSFTIRKDRDTGTLTEYAKRKAAIKSGGKILFPWLTCQAYAQTKDGPILSIGLTKTKDIFAFIDAGYAGINATDNATFYYCYWNHMIARKFEVKTWYPKINENKA